MFQSVKENENHKIQVGQEGTERLFAYDQITTSSIIDAALSPD